MKRPNEALTVLDSLHNHDCDSPWCAEDCHLCQAIRYIEDLETRVNHADAIVYHLALFDDGTGENIGALEDALAAAKRYAGRWGE